MKPTSELAVTVSASSSKVLIITSDVLILNKAISTALRFVPKKAKTQLLTGFKGPIKVSFGNYTYPIAWDFLRAAESQGIPVTDDLQDLTTGVN